MIQLLPNSLTWSRLFLGILFPIIPQSWQLVVFLLAALTDGIDGWLARVLKVDGSFGKHLDPVADKIFVAGVLLALLRESVFSPGEMLLLASRDVLVLLGSLWLLLTGHRWVLKGLKPSLLGKLTTFGQLLVLTVALWIHESPAVLLMVVSILGSIAGFDYIRRGRRVLFAKALPECALEVSEP